MKYVVKTRYEEFEFKVGYEALNIANALACHSVESATVTIEVTDDKCDELLGLTKEEADQ